MKSLLAGFESQREWARALDSLTAAHIETVDTYTPAPPPDDTGSPLPLAMFVAGMAGFIGFFLLMTYADVVAYPQNIGGRPPFAWPVFVPIAFELGVLCAMVVGFFGYFVLCRLQRLYDPIDEASSFKHASCDGWFVAVRGNPERRAQARAILSTLGPVSIEEFDA